MSSDSPKGHPMQITLHRPDLERFVEEKVRSGEYANPDAVVEEALVRLQGDRNDGDWTTEALREAVHVGIEQLERGEGIEIKSDTGLGTFFDDIKRVGREHLAENPTTQ